MREPIEKGQNCLEPPLNTIGVKCADWLTNILFGATLHNLRFFDL